MNAMAPTRPTELHLHRVRLTTGPAAAAQARRQVREAICAWDVPVDSEVAALLTSELVTNAIRYEASGTVMLAITCCWDQLRVDVHDTSRSLPVIVDAPGDAETGRGLMLVATLASEWGYYRTPAGKAVYFTIMSQPDCGDGDGHDPRGFTREGGEPSAPGDSPSSPDVRTASAALSAGRDVAQCRFARDVRPRIDAELLQDVRDMGGDGPPG